MANVAVREIASQAGRILNKTWYSTEMINAAERAWDLVRDLNGSNTVSANPLGVYSFTTAAVNQFRPVAVDRPSSHDYSVAGNLPYDNSNGLINAARTPIDRTAYFKWQEITMTAASEAECMDGSDYKTYVNLTPAINNFLVFMESGGVCVDFETCTGRIPQVQMNADGTITPRMNVTQGRDYDYDVALGRYNYESSSSVRSVAIEPPAARNPSGIPRNYMIGMTGDPISNAVGTIYNAGVKDNTAVLNAPMLSRFGLAEATKFKMQDWNIVFLPYCSADTHTGDRRNLYQSVVNPNESKLVRHSGIHNILASLSVLRNQLPRPAQVLLYGQSAGAIDTDFVRPLVRKVLDPSDRLYAMADSAAMPAETGTFYAQACAASKAAYLATTFLAGMKARWWGYTGAVASTRYQPVAEIDGNTVAAGFVQSRDYHWVPAAGLNAKTTFTLMQVIAPGLDINNLNNWNEKITQAFSRDRMLYVMSKSDTVMPKYIYFQNERRVAAALADGNINLHGVEVFLTHLGAYQRRLWGKEMIHLQGQCQQQQYRHICNQRPSNVWLSCINWIQLRRFYQ